MMTADHQRIHPVQETATPSAPLVARGSSRSENGDPERQYYPHHTKPHKKRASCCKKCFCWTFCFFLVLIILVGVLAAIIYWGFDPKIPNYSVDSMQITRFNYSNIDDSLSATFNVNVTARNPNSKIGIYYVSGSHLSVWYSGRRLSEGSLPRFYQGHRNTTLLTLQLDGQTNNATGLLQSLQTDQQTGSVPLNVRARVPVRLRLGNLRLMRWNFLVRCNLLVDSLSTGNNIRITDNRCRFRFRF